MIEVICTDEDVVGWRIYSCARDGGKVQTCD